MGDGLPDTDDSDLFIFLYHGIDLTIDFCFFFIRHIWVECYFDLCIIGSLSMGIGISTPEYRSSSFYSRNLSEFQREIFCDIERIFERTPWFCSDRDSITRFIECWKSLLTRCDISKQSKWDRNKSNKESKLWVSEAPKDRFFCKSLESMGEPCIFFDFPMPILDPSRQEIATDNRYKGDCHDE